MKPRLFIVSNRLPVTIEKLKDSVELRQSSGGLVSAINAYLQKSGNSSYDDVSWAGVADCSEKEWNSVMKGQEFNYEYLPLFVNRKVYEPYYNGFSNSLLWPLFHYFPSFAEFNPQHFDAYIKINRSFTELLSKKLNEDDVVWIHDYHLLPLAGMLREKFPRLSIGFFLHIPFPTHELFRLMPKPWQKEILRGMLGADLIGFHTDEYTEHFLDSCKTILGIGYRNKTISTGGREIKAGTYPISIDFDLFNNAFHAAKINKLRQEYLALKGSKKLLFSVDRLDYTKGVSNRLRGFEQFLIKYPEYREKVVFALVIVPSRDSIAKYAERKKMIDEFIGNFNSRIGTISWQPIIYQYGHLAFEELLGMYTACDLALITPMRDGMNLVSKEFVASREDKRGVLVLSEMTGAASELNDALLINPNDMNEIAEMIRYGLEMPEAEQEQRITNMRSTISKYTVSDWAEDFLTGLNEQKGRLSGTLQETENQLHEQLPVRYSSSGRRLVLLDYDGTLVPLQKAPELATPHGELLHILARLVADDKNDVFIISGRTGTDLEKWFGRLPVGLVAEHGACLKAAGKQWIKNTEAANEQVKKEIHALMEHYTKRCPGAMIETKEYSIAWHYRNVNISKYIQDINELKQHMQKAAEKFSMDLLDGDKVLEMRPQGVSKGKIVETILKNERYDLVLCIGDDKTDEDMFEALQANAMAFTIKVGNAATSAKYRLPDSAAVHRLLSVLAMFNTKYMLN